ncbi:SWIM zinc finger family protein [Halomarina ordinaria]|uniref:SWIM zinc finger family protein n=1 Tax=Halomarina ordinaria TaxID=3033939 RepID=A0ABD5UA97_9EURY|nr:SWIM zinc finger family protein [Halomarina sp. PSRA2]
MTPTEITPASPRTALAPDTRRLDPRAARAWTERMAVSVRGGGVYDVYSQSGHTYTVDLVDGVCSCPDNQYREERCKHIRRVALEITGGRVPAPGYRAVTCRGCGREAFVREERPALCDDCYLPPGTTVRDRETDALVVVVEPSDVPADESPVPLRQTTLDEVARDLPTVETTVADYPGNERYPADDPVVRVVYPFSGPADGEFEDLQRYSFPLSRLERVAPRERAPPALTV